MIGKKKFGILAAGVMVAAATAFSAASLVSGTAHAQATGSLSLTSVNTFQQPIVGNQTQTEWEAVFSVTCTQGDGGDVRTNVTQYSTYTGSSAIFACTGNPQTVDVVLEPSGSGTYAFAPGSVSVNAELLTGPPVFNSYSATSPTAGFASQSAAVN